MPSHVCTCSSLKYLLIRNSSQVPCPLWPFPKELVTGLSVLLMYFIIVYVSQLCIIYVFPFPYLDCELLYARGYLFYFWFTNAQHRVWNILLKNIYFWIYLCAHGYQIAEGKTFLDHSRSGSQFKIFGSKRKFNRIWKKKVKNLHVYSCIMGISWSVLVCRIIETLDYDFLFCSYFVPALLKYYWNPGKFKVWNMMISYMYILWNYYHNKLTRHLHSLT